MLSIYSGQPVTSAAMQIRMHYLFAAYKKFLKNDCEDFVN